MLFRSFLWVVTLSLIGVLIPGTVLGDANTTTTPSLSASSLWRYTGAYFIRHSPSVQSIGMGQTGVALPTVGSVHSNPGVLGFRQDYRCARVSLSPLSFWIDSHPYSNYPDQRMNNLSLEASILGGGDHGNSLILSAAIGRTRVSTEGWVEWTWYPEPQNEYVDLRDAVDNVSIGFGLAGWVEVGFGATAKWIRQWQSGHEYTDTYGIDIGMLARKSYWTNKHLGRYNLTVTPSMGASWSNLGPSWNNDHYILPKSRCLGLALEFDLVYTSRYDTLKALSVIPTVEYEKSLSNDDTWYRIGIETEFYQAGALRFGIIKPADGHSRYTLGCSLQNRGLARLFGRAPKSGDNQRSPGSARLLLDVLQIELSYATMINRYSSANTTSHYLMLSIGY